MEIKIKNEKHKDIMELINELLFERKVIGGWGFIDDAGTTAELIQSFRALDHQINDETLLELRAYAKDYHGDDLELTVNFRLKISEDFATISFADIEFLWDEKTSCMKVKAEKFQPYVEEVWNRLCSGCLDITI